MSDDQPNVNNTRHVSTEEMMRDLAQFVPHLRARKGVLPNVGEGFDALGLNLSDGTLMAVLTDEANHFDHVFNFDADTHPAKALATAKGIVYAPYN